MGRGEEGVVRGVKCRGMKGYLVSEDVKEEWKRGRRVVAMVMGKVFCVSVLFKRYPDWFLLCDVGRVYIFGGRGVTEK